MEAITSLGAILGLAFVSGIRLYSTVFAVGLGMRLGLLQLPEQLAHLEILAATPILVIAGTAYAVEFLADKIPWVDSLWDAVHTFIRPMGAAILGLAAVGDVTPMLKLGAFMLCGTVALTSHSAKAGTRLLVNHSPEPVTNIGVSLAEDALVVGGLWLILHHPIIALVIVLLMTSLIVWLIPKILRLFRRNLSRLVGFFRRKRPALDVPLVPQ
jgi:hypothetical protein